MKKDIGKILSYGAGVNSTAILALVKLGKIEMPDRIIFCDTGAERPETYCYLKYIAKIFPIEIYKKSDENLIEYCQKRNIIPMRSFRWCTDKFKIRVFRKHTKDIEYIKILGISADEAHRRKDMTCDYPLCDLLITRQECIRLIKKAGLDVPVKSGCYICPNMKKQETLNLKKYNPEQYKILIELEHNALKRNPKMFFKDDKPIEKWLGNDMTDYFDGFDNYQHCLCKYD